MRASPAAACCALALLLVTLPAQINAASGMTEAASHSAERQLLVVNHNVTATSSSIESQSQPVNGSATSFVGANVILPDLEPKNSAASADRTPEAAFRAGTQQGRSRRQQQGGHAQKQRALGRKGGPDSKRQATAGAPTNGGGGGDGDGDGDASLPEVFVGSLDDYVLPFCQPSEGVVCSDNDKTDLLKAQPAVISLDDSYPYAQVKPAASYAASSVNNLDFLAYTFSNKNQGVTKASLDTLAGTEAANAATTVTSTALQTTVDASRADRVIPDAVSVVADRNAAEGTYERKSWRPRFTYQIGANYGLPVGLATVADEIGK